MPKHFPLSVTLVAAPEGDAPISSPSYQLELTRFKTKTTPQSFSAYTVDSAGGTGHLLGNFSYEHVKDVLTILAPAAIAFIAGVAGRKVRLRVGDVETEARSTEEVEKLLVLAEAHAKRMSEPISSPEINQYWLGFLSEQGAKDVKSFATEAQALRYRETAKEAWRVPASVTIPFQAATREEALEKMDRY